MTKMGPLGGMMARVFPLGEGALGNWAFYAQGSGGSTLP